MNDPERTGEEGGPEDGSDNPPPPPPADHSEQVQAIAALFGPSRPKDVVTGTDAHKSSASLESRKEREKYTDFLLLTNLLCKRRHNF